MLLGKIILKNSLKRLNELAPSAITDNIGAKRSPPRKRRQSDYWADLGNRIPQQGAENCRLALR